MASAVNPVAHLQNNAAAWWWKDPGLRSLTVGILVGFASNIATGYDGAVMTGLQANHRFMASIDNPSAGKLGNIVAAQALGTLPGFIPAAYYTDRFGRRVAIGTSLVGIIVAALVQTFTTGGWKMFGSRFLLGFLASFGIIAGGPYVTEIAHPRNRAQTTALLNTCFYVGSIIAAWVTFGTIYLADRSDWSWRMCLLFQIICPVIALAMLPFAPESPRWLVSKGRIEDAHKMLAKYHANGDKDDELVLYELREIIEATELDKQAKGVSWFAFFKTRGNRLRLVIVVTIAFTSQWIGNGVITAYLVPILQSIGITNSLQQTGYNVGLQVFNWLAAIGGALACERFGRRKLWLTSATIMFFSYIIITACSAAYANGHAAAGKAVMAFIFVYFGGYDIAYTGLTLAYPLEILPTYLRSKGIAILMLCVTSSGVFNAYVNPIALEAIAWKYYFVFIGVNIFAILMIFFVFPETKGRMLEEIAELFDGPNAALTPHSQLVHGDDMKERNEHLEEAESRSAV